MSNEPYSLEDAHRDGRHSSHDPFFLANCVLCKEDPTPDVKRYHATVLLNLTAHYSDALPDRDLFVSLEETSSFVVDAFSLCEAREKLFEIGNRQARDLNGKGWSSDVRSMSVGDVVILHEFMAKGGYFACDNDGWRDVTDYTLNWISGTPMAYQLADRFNAARIPVPEMG